jgi:hypothetical protein
MLAVRKAKWGKGKSLTSEEVSYIKSTATATAEASKRQQDAGGTRRKS